MIVTYIVLALFAFFGVLIQIDSYSSKITGIQDILDINKQIRNNTGYTKVGKFIMLSMLYTWYVLLAPTLLFWYVVTKLIPSILYKKEI